MLLPICAEDHSLVPLFPQQRNVMQYCVQPRYMQVHAIEKGISIFRLISVINPWLGLPAIESPIEYWYQSSIGPADGDIIIHHKEHKWRRPQGIFISFPDQHFIQVTGRFNKAIILGSRWPGIFLQDPKPTRRSMLNPMKIFFITKPFIAVFLKGEVNI